MARSRLVVTNQPTHSVEADLVQTDQALIGRTPYPDRGVRYRPRAFALLAGCSAGSASFPIRAAGQVFLTAALTPDLVEAPGAALPPPP